MRLLSVVSVVATLTLMATAGFAAQGKPDGKAGFDKYCASCHPAGGNSVNPAKTLKKGDLAKSGIKNSKDLIAKMRKPGPGMTAFDAKTIPEKEAKAIADYILKTFK